MMTFSSRYHPRYVRSLVYMLQASEYHPLEYVSWLRRTRDFRDIEKRKRLDVTLKARFLLCAGWGILLALYLLAFSLLVFLPLPMDIVLAVFVAAAAPFALAYGIIVPLLLFEWLIQKPVQYVVLSRVRARLAAHSAVKIAVAGSFGKTSMREILKTVLSEGKRVAAPSGSQNTPLGIARFTRTLSGDEEILVFELGEYYPGDVAELCELVQPDIGVITGVNEAHLEKFKDLERTANTIFEVADYLKDKPLYVNGESEHASKRAADSHIRYGRAGAGAWRVLSSRSDLDGTSVEFAGRDGATVRATSKLLGLHHVGALAAAADIASRLGLRAEDIRRGIEKTAPFEHRLELKRQGDDVILLDDSYNGNPDGVRAAIAFLGSLNNHRRFYVTPGLVEMGPRAKAVHRAIGRHLADAGIEHVVLIRNSVSPHIESGLRDARYGGKVTWFPDGPAAFAALPSMTLPGDVVLLQNDWPDQYV